MITSFQSISLFVLTLSLPSTPGKSKSKAISKQPCCKGKHSAAAAAAALSVTHCILAHADHHRPCAGDRHEAALCAHGPIQCGTFMAGRV
eukprot:1139113-Pelagomonas_calceolata.AAC.4